jgi:hypothetical protein
MLTTGRCSTRQFDELNTHSGDDSLVAGMAGRLVGKAAHRPNAPSGAAYYVAGNG